MSARILAPPLAGHVLGGPDTSFVIAEWSDPGGPSSHPRLIAPWHVHHKDDEAWYVLEGLLHIRCGEELHKAGAGSAVFVPRGTPHTYWNPGPNQTRYLLIMTPNIYQLIQEIHVATDRSPMALRALFQRHNSDLLDLPQVPLPEPGFERRPAIP